MTWPVIQAASSEASHAIRRAASSGVPTRPAGIFGSRMRASASSIQPVSVGPGLTLKLQKARAPGGASKRVVPSKASARLHAGAPPKGAPPGR